MEASQIVLIVLLISTLKLADGVVQRNGCKAEVDIVVIVDQSNKILPEDYQQMKQFIMDLSLSFGISQHTAHISLVLAYHDTDVILHLDDIFNDDHVIRLVQQLIQYRDPFIQLGRALRKAREEINGPSGRLLAKKVVIILTNGISRDSFMDDAFALRKETDMVYAIGFGKFLDSYALSFLASAQQNTYVVPPRENTESKLEKISHNIMDITCRSCRVDVCFMIDIEVGKHNIEQIQDIMQSYIKVFAAGQNVRFSVVEASDESQIMIRLDNDLTLPLLKRYIQSLNYSDYPPGIAHLGMSLAVVKDDLFTDSFPGNRKLLVAFTNGNSVDSAEYLSLKLKSSGVFIQVYSFGEDLYMPNLVAMATDRGRSNIFRNSNGHVAEEKALTARASICGGCKDKSIFCPQMALWGLCDRGLRAREKCPASCRVCYNTRMSGWMQKWKKIMRFKGPFSRRSFKFIS